MQFEPPLGQTFNDYRQATNDLVQWIASTARATGTVQDLFKGAQPPTAQSFFQKLKDKRAGPASLVQKLKGRMRDPHKCTQCSALPSTTEISFKALRRLGKAIASSESIQVPYNVLVVLKGIIEARKSFAT